MKINYTDRAKDDIELAILWYEKQKKGLGFEFFDCIKESEKLISNQPKMYSVSYSKYRGCVLRRFPFSIYYTIEKNNEIIVHSVFDNRQDPNKKP